MTVEKSTVIENTWKAFFDRLKDQVKTVSITGSTTITIQNYVSTFPDNLIDSKSDYPILVVESPIFSGDTFTIGKEQLSGKISIDIYTNQGESADKFLSKIMDSVETYKHTFRDNGLSMIKVDGITNDSVSRDKIKLHIRSVVFAFNFHYNKTGAY